jgi:hypothetical protein
MKVIESCSVPGCGLRIGYELALGAEICWLHADKRKLPAHIEWKLDAAAFLKDFELHFFRAKTARDTYGMLGI